MNKSIFALARIKIAPYGNLVGNCRDIVDANEEKTAAVCEGQSSDSFCANCLSPMRQNCGKNKNCGRHTAH